MKRLYPNRFCPFCRAPNDADTAVTNEDDHQPIEGDYSICFSCAELCVFGIGATTLLRPTEEQRKFAMDDKDLRQVIFKAQMLVPEFNKKVRREPTS